MGYVHVEVTVSQAPKRAEGPCGDLVAVERTPSATTVVLADGLGTGAPANVAATICASRLLELLRQGWSARKAFSNVLRTMNMARRTGDPFAAFTLARVLRDGTATVTSYEMPEALLVGRSSSVGIMTAAPLTRRVATVEDAVVAESHCHLGPGDGILLVSDGVTHSALGTGPRPSEGWTADGIARFCHSRLLEDPGCRLEESVHREALRLWQATRSRRGGGVCGDDCTAAYLRCREGLVVNVLTGPPADRARDEEVVRRFLSSEGAHVVCGGSTGAMVAKITGSDLQIDPRDVGLLAPPGYRLKGVHLATEGAVTLNHVYNVIDDDAAIGEAEGAVGTLASLLASSDRVNFVVGMSGNSGNPASGFRQLGLVSRSNIVPLIADKLRDQGKLVVIDYV